MGLARVQMFQPTMPDIALDPAISRRKRYKRLVAAAAATGALLAPVIWLFLRPSVGSSVRRSDVWVATVKHGSLPIVVSAAGVFRPIQERWITAATPGVVEEVLVQAGDEVKPGTVLAVLANPAIDSALAQASAKLASAEAQRASLRAALTSQLLTLRGDLAAAQANATTLAVKERAERPLIRSHIISVLEYTAIRVQANEYAQLAKLAQDRITAFRLSIAAQKRAASAQVAARRAVLENTREQVSALSVTAGMEGVVQTVALHTGQTLTVGDGIARVASLKSFKATLQVPASEAEEVAVGQSVTLQLATDVTQDVEGRVSRVSPTVRNGNVEVDVMPRGELPTSVRPNLAVTGEIDIADIARAVYVQRPAYANPDSVMTLFQLVDGGRAAIPVRVRFGAASDQYIQITGGLQPGTRVIVSDTSGFAGNRRITLR